MDDSDASQGGLMPPRVKSPTPLQNHVREWRLMRKMTLQQVADAIGASKSHMSNVELGVHTLMPAAAEAIARLFGISVEMLLRQKPGVEARLEMELLALFRGGDAAQRRAMVEMARTLRAMDRGETR